MLVWRAKRIQLSTLMEHVMSARREVAVRSSGYVYITLSLSHHRRREIGLKGRHRQVMS
jgi:hypothetical protein